MKYVPLLNSLLTLLLFNTTVNRQLDTLEIKNPYQFAYIDISRYIEKYFPKSKKIFIEESLITNSMIDYSRVNLDVRLIKGSDLKSKNFLRLVPMQVENGLLVVNVLYFKIDSKRSKSNWAINSGGIKYYFKLDCNSGKLFLEKTDGGLPADFN